MSGWKLTSRELRLPDLEFSSHAEAIAALLDIIQGAEWTAESLQQALDSVNSIPDEEEAEFVLIFSQIGIKMPISLQRTS